LVRDVAVAGHRIADALFERLADFSGPDFPLPTDAENAFRQGTLCFPLL
jgi:hypothetical protein